MGQDTRSILDHRIDLSAPEAIREKLEETTAGLLNALETVSLVRTSSPIEHWEVRPSSVLFPNVQSVRLLGPYSFVIDIFPKAIVIGSWLRWKEFVRGDHVRDEYRRIIRAFAAVFHSTYVVYLPDSGLKAAEEMLNQVYEGRMPDTNAELFPLEAEAAAGRLHLDSCYVEYLTT